jgi:large subunit ribosomal protein L9
MDIILKQDIPNLGHKDDIVSVKDGYARNYLIPNEMAIMANASTRKMHEEILRQRAHKEEALKQEAEELAQKLSEVKLKLGAKTSSAGKIFGSVNTIQIAEALREEGYELDRKNIQLPEDLIKETGSYTAKIKLHKDVYANVDFEVISE